MLRALPLVLSLAALAGPAAAEAALARFAEAGVVHIATQDEDGDPRDTAVWIVVVDGAAYVRTNDSRWLANIRRGSSVALQLDDLTLPVVAEEVSDPALAPRIDEAYKAKYGFVQRVMSFFRMREPTLLRLREKAG